LHKSMVEQLAKAVCDRATRHADEVVRSDSTVRVSRSPEVAIGELFGASDHSSGIEQLIALHFCVRTVRDSGTTK